MYIKNFRGYKEQTVEFYDNLNVIIGKNDVGKSTILEALEIFFNNESVKIDTYDLNKKRENIEDKEIIIQVSFKIDHTKTYTIDTIPTQLSKEFLLDSNNYLTIRKVWNASGQNITKTSLKTFLLSNYPISKFPTPLICKKITEIKKDLSKFEDTHDTSVINKTICSSIRKAIYDFSNIQASDLIETPI